MLNGGTREWLKLYTICLHMMPPVCGMKTSDYNIATEMLVRDFDI
jgi:hypothetical protein